MVLYPVFRTRLIPPLIPFLAALSGCVDYAGPVDPAAPVAPTAAPTSGAVSVKSFAAMVARVEPIAEAECRARTRNLNCDFHVVVETDPSAPSNAFQSVDKSGRPVLAFTVALLADAQNLDEVAFIFGHEASHHIAGHLQSTQASAVGGGVLAGILAASLGVDARGIETAQNLGASVGARTYSKNFELEADQLGTIIAYRAGYNPVRGAAFFTRIPDPGDRFLGSHPPNAQRIETVKRTMANL
ncbi:M48 family metalloprotease [Celeribacter arenosi]|uniref:M48 family metallopeptidase n=1 Tax=Celeribacter arenosi TaxID=792649 RepID=A0ABP7K3H1_9RHOB